MDRGRADSPASQVIADKIYEAVFVPELWEALFRSLIADTDSASGSMLLFGKSGPPSFVATELTRPGMVRFFQGDDWRSIIRNDVARTLEWTGFRCDVDFLSPQQIQCDPVDRQLRLLGLSWQLGCYAVLPTGETAVFTFERFTKDGRHCRKSVEFLDCLRPHLFRASMLAVKLGLERARAMVEALDVVGLPAAALRQNGTVLATNPAFERLHPLVRPSAFGMISLGERGADALLKGAFALDVAGRDQTVLSIPIKAMHDRAAAVVHLFPIRGEAFYTIGGARWFMIVTRAGHHPGRLNPVMIRSLFDLSPAEARLADALLRNVRLTEYGISNGLSQNTIKTHLKHIFGKTGVTRQADLISLLSSLSLDTPLTD